MQYVRLCFGVGVIVCVPASSVMFVVSVCVSVPTKGRGPCSVHVTVAVLACLVDVAVVVCPVDVAISV